MFEIEIFHNNFRNLLPSDELKRWKNGIKRIWKGMEFDFGQCWCRGPGCHMCNPSCEAESSEECINYRRAQCSLCRGRACNCYPGCSGVGTEACGFSFAPRPSPKPKN